MSLEFNGLAIAGQSSGLGLSSRRAVRVATVASGTLGSDFDNGKTVDGVVLATGDRILIKNQVSGVDNGVYLVNAVGQPTRSDDFSANEQVSAAFIFVQEGTINAETGWLCINDEGSDIVTIDPLQFMLTTGDVSNSTSGVSTDNAFVRWDGTTGTLIQNSGAILDDSNNASGFNNVALGGYIEVADITAPANPGAGLGRLYKKTGDDGLFWLPDGAGAEVDLTDIGGGSVDLQGAYDNSTGGATPEIVLDSTRNALTIRDNSTPLAGNLLEIQNNAGSSTYFAVDTTGILVEGGATFTETGSNPFTPAAGQGTVWVRNDTEQKAVFSDDSGNDYILNPLTSAGDIFIHDDTEETRLPVGTDGQVLSANSALAEGLEWITPNPIFTLNGLTPQTQFLAVTPPESALTITSSVDTHTFDLKDASLTEDGTVNTVAQSFFGQKLFTSPAPDIGFVNCEDAEILNGDSLTINVPAGSIADTMQMVAFITIRGGFQNEPDNAIPWTDTPAIASVPAGWTLIAQETNTVTYTQTVFVYIKTVTPPEPASYTWSGFTPGPSSPAIGTWTADFAGTTMTLTSGVTGEFATGQTITGGSIPASTTIVTLDSGTFGASGSTYTISNAHTETGVSVSGNGPKTNFTAGGINTFSSASTFNAVDAIASQTTPDSLTHATPTITTTQQKTLLVGYFSYASVASGWTFGGVTFTGTISGTTLTLNTAATGPFVIGLVITGAGVSAGTVIEELLTGTLGDIGSTYTVSVSQTVGPVAMTGGLNQSCGSGVGPGGTGPEPVGNSFITGYALNVDAGLIGPYEATAANDADVGLTVLLALRQTDQANLTVQGAETQGTDLYRNIDNDGNILSGFSSIGELFIGGVGDNLDPNVITFRTDTAPAALAADYILTVPSGDDTLAILDGTQTFTNKTMTDPSNNLIARALFVDSGASSVSTFAAAPPTVGQALVATSATTATWQTIGGGGGNTIIVQDEGVNIPATPNTTLDFVGAGVTASDGGGGVATITIPDGGADKVTKGGDTDAAALIVGTNDANDLELETDGTTRMTVTSGGDIQLGPNTTNIVTVGADAATAPLGFFDVRRVGVGSSDHIRFTVSDDTNVDTYNIGVDTGDTGSVTITSEDGSFRQAFVMASDGTGTSSHIGFANSSNGGTTWNPRWVINAAGNMGVSKNDPTQPLDILGNVKIDTGNILDTNDNELFVLTATGAAVNELTIANAATGTAPSITASGDDVDVDLSLQPKGAGNLILDLHTFPNADGSANQALVTDGANTLSFADVPIRTIETLTTVGGGFNNIGTAIPTVTDTTYVLFCIAAGRRTDSGTESAGYLHRATFRNNGGALSLVAQGRQAMEDVGGWQIRAVVAGTTIQYQVQAAAGANCRLEN